MRYFPQDWYSEHIPNKKFQHDARFISVGNFYDGLARVELSYNNNLFNFIKLDGSLLSEECFIYAQHFSDGLARVENTDYMYNFLKTDGTYLSDKWFKYAGTFHNGLAVVSRYFHNGEVQYNYIKPDGSYLSQEWFDIAEDFFCGVGIVARDRQHYNYLKTDGSFLLQEWFLEVERFNYDFARVKRDFDKKSNIITLDGTFLSEEWFTKIHPYFAHGHALVDRYSSSGKLLGSNVLRTDGTLAFPNWDGHFEIDFPRKNLVAVDKDGNIVQHLQV